MSELNFPEKLKYNKDYSWVKLDKEKATIGIIAPSAKKVKEFVFIKLPEKGKKIKTGQKYVSLEAVKWSGHLSSPVTGEITDVNEALFNEPSKINKSPYSAWIMKVKIEKTKKAEKLLNSKEAKKFYEEKIK
jgi:glycine cleavage system H protein